MLLWILALLLLLFMARYFRVGPHYYFFVIFFFVSHFFYFYAKVYILNSDLSKIESDIYIKAIILLLCVVGGYFISDLFRRKMKTTLTISTNRDKELFLIYLILFLIGLSLYVLKNGISLSQDYNSRIEKNAGGGAFIILMYSYVPCLVFFYKMRLTKFRLVQSLFLAFVFGMVYYIVIGGSRNLLAAGIFVILYIAVEMKHVSIKQLILLSLSGFVFLLGMELFRYSNDILAVLDFFNRDLGSKIFFIFESFSPINAASTISLALNDNLISPQLLSPFFNEFGILIPRILWPEKPLNVINSGYFYTVEVLKLDTNLTISPTLLGSFLIMFGNQFYWVLGLFTGYILNSFDAILRNYGHDFFKISILASIGYLFFWVRDGFEVYCYVLIKFYLAILLGRFILSAYIFITPRRNLSVER